MHIKTALQMPNAIQKVETTDLDGKIVKDMTQAYILEQCRPLFPELEIVYQPGQGFTSRRKKLDFKNWNK